MHGKWITPHLFACTHIHMYPQTRTTYGNLQNPPWPHSPIHWCILVFSFSADAFGCRIEINSKNAVTKPQYKNQKPGTIYSCTPGNSSTQYEVHVLAVYDGVKRRRYSSTPAGKINVNIVSRGRSGKSIILVLGSFEPVKWTIYLQGRINISKVILVSTWN